MVVDLPRCGPMLNPRAPNLVPIPGPRMERETPGQRPRPNYGHPHAGIRGLGYDMALSSEGIDKTLDRHLVPVVKVPRLKGNRFRGQALGPHRFTTAAGDDLDIDVKTLNGCPWVWMPSGDKLQAVPLKRRKLQWGTRGKQKTILYMRAAIPVADDVPEPLRGATTLIRVNSTDAEINNKPRHTLWVPETRPWSLTCRDAGRC